MIGASALLVTMLQTAEAGGGPVMAGADVVHHFGLQPDEPGLIAKDGTHKRMYGGYEFWFSNESNAEAFAENPTKYMPLWGGF